MVKAGCYIGLTLSTSEMSVHGTVSTTVCKALVSPSSAVYVPSLLLQAVYKTEIVGCHLSHLCGGAQRDILLSFGMPDFL